MAKTCMIEREKKRHKTVARLRHKRLALKAALKNPAVEYEERMRVIAQLQKLPRDASPCRLRNRCRITGRPKGYYRKFGLGRNKLREYAMLGYIPGLVKSSW